MLSPAGTTHLVTRLERDGLVRREVDPADGRKWFTVLTPAGGNARHQRNSTCCSASGDDCASLGRKRRR